MTMCLPLAFAAAVALAAADPAQSIAPIAPAATNAVAVPNPALSGPVAVQFVQVQYRNVLKSRNTSSSANVASSVVKSHATSFVLSLVQKVLSHANPLVGFLVNTIASRLTSRLNSYAPPPVRSQADINVVPEFEATTSIASDRTRMDVATVTTIVQCDLNKVLLVDNAARTYSIAPLDATADAASNSPMDMMFGGQPDPDQTTADPQPDDGTETIAGLLAHHAIFTSSAAGGFGGSHKTDLWYADVPVPDRCSATANRITRSGGPVSGGKDPSMRIPLRSVEWSEMFFSAPAPTPIPSGAATQTYSDPMLGRAGFAWMETKAVTEMPYDPAFFDVPAGYALTTPSPDAAATLAPDTSAPATPASPEPTVSPTPAFH